MLIERDALSLGIISGRRLQPSEAAYKDGAVDYIKHIL